ncbi:MAG: glycosyltransferase family 2 protein [Pyrinomonadaceae bacterium]
MFFSKSATIVFVKISAVIIAFNEESKIAAAINSVKWADEILLIDSESTDRTKEISATLGAKVITQKWLGFSKQKQLAVDNAEHDWIFSLDSDEVVSEQLKNEILKLKNSANLADGYKIPRLSFYMNRPIRHGGWYPDWQIRFFDRRRGEWKDVLIHESVEIDGKIEKLAGDILHYSVENMAHHHQMIGERYAPLAAEQMFLRGRKTSPLKVATAGLTAFLQTYILKAGFLDGFPGFCIARFAAHHAFLKHLLLWEKQNNR